MKKVLFLMVITLFAFGMNVSAGNIKKEAFKVSGNCGICKTRIEKAAKSVPGVATANWNQSTKILAVSYDEKKTGKENIQKAIAKAGHDTGKFKADSKTYNALPSCCQYRK